MGRGWAEAGDTVETRLERLRRAKFMLRHDLHCRRHVGCHHEQSRTLRPPPLAPRFSRAAAAPASYPARPGGLATKVSYFVFKSAIKCTRVQMGT